jgi:hypothetical protein
MNKVLISRKLCPKSNTSNLNSPAKNNCPVFVLKLQFSGAFLYLRNFRFFAQKTFQLQLELEKICKRLDFLQFFVGKSYLNVITSSQ